jgi:hypothetical protein
MDDRLRDGGVPRSLSRINPSRNTLCRCVTELAFVGIISRMLGRACNTGLTPRHLPYTKHPHYKVKDSSPCRGGACGSRIVNSAKLRDSLDLPHPTQARDVVPRKLSSAQTM